MARILRLPDVIAKTGLSKASIYRLISEGTFPPSIRLMGDEMGPNSPIGWIEKQVDEWIEDMARTAPISSTRNKKLHRRGKDGLPVWRRPKVAAA